MGCNPTFKVSLEQAVRPTQHCGRIFLKKFRGRKFFASAPRAPRQESIGECFEQIAGCVQQRRLRLVERAAGLVKPPPGSGFDHPRALERIDRQAAFLENCAGGTPKFSRA